MYRSGGRGTFKPPSFLQRTDSASSGSAGPSAPAPPPRYAANETPDRSAPSLKRKSSAASSHLTGEDGEAEEDSRTSASHTPQRGQTSSAHTPPMPRLSSLTRQSGGSAAPLPHRSPANGTSEGEEYYMCTWRKPQGRKHKTWDGDAVLIVNRAQGTCKLKCQESGRELGFSNKLIAEDLSGGEELAVGGKEIEIDRQISHREYLSGIPGQPIYPPKKVKAKQADSRAMSVQPTTPSSSRTQGLLAAAPSASFYSKPLPQPRTKQNTDRLSPEVGRALQEESSTKKASSSSSKIAPTAVQPRPHGLFNPETQPESRYDPAAPGAIVLKRPDADHQKKYNRRNLPIVDVVINPILSEALRPHQVEGVRLLYERVTGITDVNGQKGAILADEMGLGKTLQTITLIETLLRQSPYYTSKPCVIEKALVVCPLSLVKNWKREFRKWLGPTTIGVVAVDGSKSKEATQRFVTSRRDQVLIIGYEKLRTCIDILSTAQPQIGLIVCDEGHRLKSKDTKTNKIFAQLSTSRRIILTGTPIQNDLSELYAMIDFVCPGLLGSYNSFKAIFEDPILKSRVQHCSKEVRDLGAQRSLTLSTVTQLVVIRRTADILDGFLLPKNETVIFCSPSKLQLELYRRVLKSTEVRALTSGSAGGSALPLITMLRQICDSPELLLKEGMASASSNGTLAGDLLSDARHLFPSRKVTGDETLSGKLTVISRMLKKIKSTTDDKVVLVSTFTSTLDVLEAFCKKLRYPYVRLDGQTKQDDRLDIVNTFNRSPVRSSFVFLLSTRAGGVGLNLIGANRLFLLEPEWNPALDQQAMARIHRDGQQKHCFIYRMMLSGTMDEKIFQRQITKLGLSDTLMNTSSSKDKKNVGRGGDSGKRGKGGDSFSQEELKDIFTLHEDTPCLCHDLLICTCGGNGVLLGDGEQGGDGEREHSSDEDSPPPPSFIPASMQQATRDAQLAKEARSRLAGLADWRHVDLTNPASFTPLNDEILNAVVAAQAPMHGAEPAIKQEKGLHLQLRSDEDDEEEDLVSPPPEETDGASHKGKSLLELTDLDVLEASVARDARKAAAAALKRRQEEELERERERELAMDNGRRYYAGGRAAGWDIGLFEGGSVLYAFTKTSGATTAGVGEDDDDDEEEEVRISPVLEAEEAGIDKAADVEADEASQEMRAAGKRKRTSRASARLLESDDEEEASRGSRLFLAQDDDEEKEQKGEDDDDQAGEEEEDSIMDLLDAEEGE